MNTAGRLRHARRSLVSQAPFLSTAAALAIAVSSIGCEPTAGALAEQQSPDALASDASADTTPTPDLAGRKVRRLVQGTNPSLTPDCSVGIIWVSREGGGVSASDSRQGLGVRQTLKIGQLMIACGQLYQVLGTHFDGRGELIIDSDPTPRPALRPDSLVLPLGGESYGPRSNIVLKELVLGNQDAGKPVATFQVWIGSKRESQITAGAGDVVTIAGGRYRVVGIESVNQETGVPGWVELAAE